jgi:hypothetical protein
VELNLAFVEQTNESWPRDVEKIGSTRLVEG